MAGGGDGAGSYVISCGMMPSPHPSPTGEGENTKNGNKVAVLHLLDAEKQKACFKSRLFKFGSSDWTRTSDIRINSPPFYRLNYRGIV